MNLVLRHQCLIHGPFERDSNKKEKKEIKGLHGMDTGGIVSGPKILKQQRIVGVFIDGKTEIEKKA